MRRLIAALILTLSRAQLDLSNREPRAEMRNLLEHVGNGVQFKLIKENRNPTHLRGDSEIAWRASVIAAVSKAVSHIAGCREPTRLFPSAGLSSFLQINKY